MFEVEKNENNTSEVQHTVPFEVEVAITLAISEALNFHEQGYDGNRMRRVYIDSPKALNFIAHYFHEPEFTNGVPVTAYVQGDRLRLAINSWDEFIRDPQTGDHVLDKTDGHKLMSDVNPLDSPSIVEYMTLEQAKAIVAQHAQIEE